MTPRNYHYARNSKTNQNRYGKKVDLIDAVNVPGRIEVQQNRLAKIGSPVVGRISDIRVTLGQKVKQNEVLAKVNSVELTQMQLSYIKAKQQIELKTKAFERAELLFNAGVISKAEMLRIQTELEAVKAELTPHNTWHFKDKEALISDMTKKIKTIPGIQTNFSQVIEDSVEESISGVKGEIAIKIFGPDLNVLEDKAEQVTSIIKKFVAQLMSPQLKSVVNPKLISY